MKSSMSQCIVSNNNAFIILHNLHIRCSASFMFYLSFYCTVYTVYTVEPSRLT